MYLNSLFRHNKLAYITFAFATFLNINSPALADNPNIFTARATLALCPEYQLGNVTIDVKYSIGDDTQLYSAQIISSEIDTETNSGTFDIELPSNTSNTKVNVMAYCNSKTRGISDASTPVSYTNCDRLAVIDSDNDGMKNSEEDLDCNNGYSPGDRCNPYNVDTDGDGIRDLVELLFGFDPTNPGDSPRPYILSGAPFDPDADGVSNPIVFRPNAVTTGRNAYATWYVKDFLTPNNHLSIQFGRRGDIPFVYNPAGGTSDLGVIRRQSDNQLIWYFRGLGFERSDGSRTNALAFGTFGDNNIILGPWEHPNITNPAVATMAGEVWSFYVYLSDGTIRHHFWGRKGDLPKVQDYDGDGIFDIAVFRPSEGISYVIQSTDGLGYTYHFGHGSYDHSVRGDVTGDGTDDITFWEPLTGNFYTLFSDNGINESAAISKDPDYYKEMQLGLYNVHVPLSWNYSHGMMLYTVVDHSNGMRYIRENNNPQKPPQALQWGLSGDSFG